MSSMSWKCLKCCAKVCTFSNNTCAFFSKVLEPRQWHHSRCLREACQPPERCGVAVARNLI